MSSKFVTFIVTKDCQLACKYCYLVRKNNQERMNWATAKQAVDFLLNNRHLFPEEALSLDFIGGEPTLEMELIDEICDYFKTKAYTINHPWFNNYVLGFTTNGLNYHCKPVQSFIEKNREHVGITITIDGTKRKHDTNRIYKSSGLGSYDDVVKNIPLWLKQFPRAVTKSTISSEDLPYVYESVMHLFSLGLKEVHINYVFENVWRDGDDELLEEQMIRLADKMVEDDLFLDHDCSLFSDFIGRPLENNDDANWCGTGKMLSIDAAGNLYPCTRFAKYSLREKLPIIIGNVWDGIDTNKLRPFLTLTRSLQSPEKCLKCEVASGCAWCQGENYDSADTETIFQRSTAICKMHKARVRANNYYWNKLYCKLEKEGRTKEDVAHKIEGTCL